MRLVNPNRADKEKYFRGISGDLQSQGIKKIGAKRERIPRFQQENLAPTKF